MAPERFNMFYILSRQSTSSQLAGRTAQSGCALRTATTGQRAKEAQALNDIKICDGALSEEAISACRNNFNSVKAVDLTGCASIVDDAARNICQDNFWMKQAVEKRDATLCENIHAESFRGVCRQSSGSI